MLARPSSSTLRLGLPSLLPSCSRTCTRNFSSLAPFRLPKGHAPRSYPTKTRTFDPSIHLKLFPSEASSTFLSSSSISHRFSSQTRQSSTMSAFKEYSLLCLENPLLGELLFNCTICRRNNSPCPSHAIDHLLTGTFCSMQTSRPRVTRLSLTSMVSSPTTPSSLRRSISLSTKTS